MTAVSRILGLSGLIALFTAIGLGSTPAMLARQQTAANQLGVSSTAQLTPAALDLARGWTGLVLRHHPGEVDPPLVVLSAMRTPNAIRALTVVRCLSTELARTHQPGSADPPAATVVHPCGTALGMSQVDEILGRNAAENISKTANEVLERGALAYADIALLMPPSGMNVPFAGTTIVIHDGQNSGTIDTVFQWTAARALLDWITPGPGSEPTVRMWYRAMIAGLERGSRLGEVVSLIDRALEIFPDDAMLLFYGGALHEAYASGHSQSALVAADLPPGFAFAIGSEAAELAKAEQFYRRAVAADPGFGAARMHLGRVLDRRGAREEAVRQLMAVPAPADSEDLYFLEIFLGQAQAHLGHRAEAAASFERAAALFPDAATPRLGLSQAARRDDDVAEATAELTRMLAVPAEHGAFDDPWWRYDLSHVRDADAQLVALRRPFLSGPRR